MSSRARGAWLCAVVLLACCAAPPLASADLVLAPGDATLKIVDKAGEPDSRAGAHPDRLLQGFKFTNTTSSPEFARDMVTDLPVGLSGDPNAVPLCPRSQIDALFGSCPPESQVGTLKTGESVLPLYSVEPAPNQAAVFAGNPFLFPVTFVGQLRSADQGLSLHLDSIEHSPFFALSEGELELWGVPADHQVGTSIPRKPLLTMPTRCGGAAPAVNIHMHTWEHPERWVNGSGDSGRPVSGCDVLGFDPDVAIALDNAVADTPTGAAIDLTVPQSEDPEGRATSQVKDVDILLPEGMTISPGGANGLATCSDSQLGLGTEADPACPGSSRVGTVELSVSSLAKPLRGSIYLGQERPGERFRLFAVAAGSGTLLKFPASLQADSNTGRLTTTLANLPQASFDRLSLRFDGGPGALLANPLGCGRAKTSAIVTPYSGNKADEWTGAVSIAGPAGKSCGPLPFGPTFSGGSTSAVAGHATAFTTTIHRGDGEQLPERLTVAFPPGVSAAVGKVEPCPEAAVVAFTCPPSARLGSTVAELGPGASPARLSGDIFFTGPYKGAPYGLAMVFKARIGPFDLGSLAVRGALRVDPLSGQVSAAMDSLPTILEGIPIRFQTIGLDLERPGFMRNPTSCAPSTVATTLRSSAGAIARPSTPFSVHGCIDLPFHPRFSMALNGGAELRREGKPGLRIGAKVPAGNANLRGAEIAFPQILALDPNGVRAICARRRAARGECSENSRVGTGFARTDLLKAPMKGSIYAVQPRGSGSPDLWTSLVGEGLRVSLQAETRVEHGRAETRLVGLPDFPLRSFTMALAGGERGLFKLRRDPCRGGALAAPMQIAGQNGARESLLAPVGLPHRCGRIAAVSSTRNRP